MLVLTRKHNETLHIGNDIVLTIVRVRGDSVRIGIQAPKEIHVMRSELLGRQPKQTAAPEQAPNSTTPQAGNGIIDAGPLTGYLKVFPKVALATAS